MDSTAEKWVARVKRLVLDRDAHEQVRQALADEAERTLDLLRARAADHPVLAKRREAAAALQVAELAWTDHQLGRSEKYDSEGWTGH